MSKELTLFIEENRNNIILCGESCIGKSYFANHNMNGQKVIHGNMAESLADIELINLLNQTSGLKKYMITGNPNPGKLTQYHRQQSARFADAVCDRARECCETKLAREKGKKIIILGAPYSIWKKRVKERRKTCKPSSIPHLDHVSKFTIDTYIGNYVKYIRHIIECRSLMPKKPIPYILVDNRNDYPILNETQFFNMLSE
jgi:hypothetical protein